MAAALYSSVALFFAAACFANITCGVPTANPGAAAASVPATAAATAAVCFTEVSAVFSALKKASKSAYGARAS